MASTQFKELPIIYGFPDGLTVVAYKKDGKFVKKIRENKMTIADHFL
jgi:hypothetical protein